MAKIDITKTELVWPGKYDDDGKLKKTELWKLPFQVIETINETRASRDARKHGLQRTLFDTWDGKEGTTFETGWKNKMIWGDNKYVMSALLEKFAGKIDLIYLDPPFATGADFSFSTQIGDDELPVNKEQSILEEKAYRDTWGKGLESFVEMIYERLSIMRDLMATNSAIYIHLDWRTIHYIKVALDEIFEKDNFMCNIIWKRISSGRKATSYKWLAVDDILLVYTKGDHKIKTQYQPYSEEYKKRFIHKDERGPYFWDNIGTYSEERLKKLETEGRIKYPDNPNAKPRMKNYLLEGKGVVVDNIWTDIPPVNSQATEDTKYATQKPEKLLERVIQASSNEGDLIADLFCGSGTTLAVAEKLGRRWIGCDMGKYAIHTTRKRLMEIENCKPFEILNLGKYERQVWQGVSFNGKDERTVFYEYLAFILKLYGAEPVAGFSNIHGRKGKALVHIGSVDAPVTIDEILNAMKETTSAGVKELQVLGWEWEMGLHDLIEEEAKKEGVKLVLKLIPNETMEAEAVRKGDVRFFDLAYLKTDIKSKGGKVTVELTDFVIPNTELIPNDVREKIKKWSDYVDYWAVDFNFQNDTFINQWTSYRTWQDRSLKLVTDPHAYKEPGKYSILVKVIDIFGIDTTQSFEIEVK